MSAEALIRLVTEEVIRQLNIEGRNLDAEKDCQIPIGISSRHIHLSREDIDILFGRGYELTLQKQLNQPGEFAAVETLQIIGPKGSFNQVRIIGPLRKQTQIEISQTDGCILGVNPPVRDSSDLSGTPGLVLVGPAGCLSLKEGVIVAARHIHFHPRDAQRLQLKNGDRVEVRIEGERGLTFANVLIRVHENYRPEMHLDTDEANAAGLKSGAAGHIEQANKGVESFGYGESG